MSSGMPGARGVIMRRFGPVDAGCPWVVDSARGAGRIFRPVANTGLGEVRQTDEELQEEVQPLVPRTKF